MRKLLLPALAACSLLAVGVPAASAHKAHTASKAHVSSNLGKKLSKARGAILGLQKTVKQLGDINLGQTAAINRNGDSIKSLGAQVQTILNGVPAIVDGLTQLKAGLVAAGAGLTALQTALQDPVTGLVGLNHARPQFGTFAAAGTILGGTGQATGASGPKANATRVSGGTYLVDFGNDVSKRSLTVAASPGSGAVVGEAVDCANAGGACGGDTSASHVLVLTYVLAATNGAATTNDAGFTVTAISG